MSRTLTALYADTATAEQAMERLRALGIPEAAMEMHRTGEGDVPPGNAPGGGLFGLRDVLGGQRTTAATVVVASGVPEDLVAEARRILKEEATEVETESEAGG